MNKVFFILGIEPLLGGLPMDIVYNIGDAINKIGFGMAVWYAAKD